MHPPFSMGEDNTERTSVAEAARRLSCCAAVGYPAQRRTSLWTAQM